MLPPNNDELDEAFEEMQEDFLKWKSQFPDADAAAFNGWMTIYMLKEVIAIVREYPDFDGGGPMAEMMDQALAGGVPDLWLAIIEFQKLYQQ